MARTELWSYRRLGNSEVSDFGSSFCDSYTGTLVLLQGLYRFDGDVETLQR